MKKMHLLIAALHASALALTAGASLAQAQDPQEVRAYMEALRAGSAEAMARFLTLYPSSPLPGSEMGASIAAGIGQPTAAVTDGTGAPADSGGAGSESVDSGVGMGGGQSDTRDHGWRGDDADRSSRIEVQDGIY